METMESASPKVRVKLWVIEHFRVLPTDSRFKELNEDQIELLFCHFINSLTDEQYKQTYYTKMNRKEVIDTMPKDLMKDMGYTEEDIEQITQGLMVGGT